jgi:hypothetical protein
MRPSTQASSDEVNLEVVDSVTESAVAEAWEMPKVPPADLGLSITQYEDLKRRLSLPDVSGVPSYKQEDLEKAGWKCYQEFRMYGMASFM